MEPEQQIFYEQPQKLQYYSFIRALEDLQHQVTDLNSALVQMHKQFMQEFEQQAQSFHTKSVIHSTVTESLRQDLQTERGMRRILEEYLLDVTKKQKLAERRLSNLDRSYRKRLNRKIAKIVLETECDIEDDDDADTYGASDTATDTIAYSSSAKKQKIIMPASSNNQNNRTF